MAEFQTDTDDRVARLKRRLERERQIRVEAEQISERVTRSLYDQQSELALHRLVAIAVNESSDADAALQTAIEHICQFLGWQVGHAYVVTDNNADLLEPMSIWSLSDAEQFQNFCMESDSRQFMRGSGLPGRVLVARKPVWLPDIDKDSNFPRIVAGQRCGLRTGMAMPLLIGDHVTAVLEFYTTQLQQADPQILKIMESVGTQLGRVLERAHTQKVLRRANEELRHTILELRAAQHRLIEQERLRALGQMASGIAHDFNNALSPIIGFSEVMLKNRAVLDNRERTVHCIETIKTAALDAASVVRRLREFYRPKDGKEAFQAIELNELVTQVIELSAPKWQAQALMKGVHIDIKNELHAPRPIHGNPHELREALLNLIFNAVEAMPKGGNIILRTSEGPLRAENEASDAPPELIKDAAKDLLPSALPQYGIIEVIDNGIGMSEEIRLKCLEPFFSTKGEHGTGLGLSMVYGIVLRHNGRISVDSLEGRGTTFSIYLPVEEASIAGAADEIDVEPGRSLSVLAVDDDGVIREVLSQYLAMDGHSCDTAVDGRDAMKKYLAGCYDLVITDQGMPHMSGEQLVAAIQSVTPSKPIIMLTGFGELMKATQTEPEGVNIVLCKPFTLRDIRQAIGEIFASK